MFMIKGVNMKFRISLKFFLNKINNNLKIKNFFKFYI